MTVWRLASPASEALALGASANLSPPMAALLWRRGVRSPEEARRFLHPSPEDLHDPLEMKGMEEAAEILGAAAAARKRIVVFGDYDVDGITAVAQLRASLCRAGADAVAFIPHRLRDGYGLKPDTVRRVVAEQRPAVIVTVDCGISAVEGVACARAAGVEVIVTDHHLV